MAGGRVARGSPLYERDGPVDRVHRADVKQMSCSRKQTAQGYATRAKSHRATPLARREPQITVRDIPRRLRQLIRRMDRSTISPDPVAVVAEPSDRPGPPDPPRQYRRRHLRSLRQQRPLPGLERRERRHPRRPFILRRALRDHGLDHRGPRDPQLPGDLSHGHQIRNQRINAQSSIVITLHSQRVFTFQAPQPFSFRASSTPWREADDL